MSTNAVALLHDTVIKTLWRKSDHTPEEKLAAFYASLWCCECNSHQQRRQMWWPLAWNLPVYDIVMFSDLCAWRLHSELNSINTFLNHSFGSMCSYVGRDSVVGIATRYGLDGPGIESSQFQWPNRLNESLWPIACWDCGFESCRGHGCLCCRGISNMRTKDIKVNDGRRNERNKKNEKKCRRKRDFPHSSRPALGLIQPSIHWVSCLFVGGKPAGAWR
jgi:hypothetical protein